MSEENKALVRRFYEAYNTGDLAVLDDIVARNFVSHQNSNSEPETGLATLKQRLTRGRTEQDLVFTIEELIAEENNVVARYLMRGTMRRAILENPDTVDKGFVVRGCAIFTVNGGKLVERWVNVDLWGRALQVGAIPS